MPCPPGLSSSRTTSTPSCHRGSKSTRKDRGSPVIVMALRQFDSSGTRLGCLGSDGLLNIWSYVEGKPANLLQKFSTSSHLAAAPTCLAWAETRATTPQSSESQHKVTLTTPLTATMFIYFPSEEEKSWDPVERHRPCGHWHSLR